MKLLLDENLSRRLVPFLQEAYPGSSQVWQHAGQHDYVLVTRDADFYDLSLTRGAPPAVLWLRINNPDKSEVLRLLTDRRDAIREAFAAGATCVELWP
ncbi:MAG: DUF5615 family PIN-like protein [Gammaproteobacteria bacterium]|jgi:predicted nuclease of predicted toxin-antitoxin system|nr:DUF5615 family PIN-like protein [Gammaproteobacteria bacterium]MBU1409029.1 DUF5615 family PIN-like protein [Gammaproteobacteria bacterium]MBU1533550.1 DUF5615 family PIN-like protein [Gammaproteobacteria bacterium]